MEKYLFDKIKVGVEIMNWTEEEVKNNPPIYLGEKNNFLFQIKRFPKNYPNQGYFVIIEDLKTNISLNSLWVNIYFKELSKIENWCLLYATYNKDIRIKKEARKNWLKQWKK